MVVDRDFSTRAYSCTPSSTALAAPRSAGSARCLPSRAGLGVEARRPVLQHHGQLRRPEPPLEGDVHRSLRPQPGRDDRGAGRHEPAHARQPHGTPPRPAGSAPPGRQAYLAKVRLYDPEGDTVTEVAEHDPERFSTGGSKFITNDEESSGVIDVSEHPRQRLVPGRRAGAQGRSPTPSSSRRASSWRSRSRRASLGRDRDGESGKPRARPGPSHSGPGPLGRLVNTARPACPR